MIFFLKLKPHPCGSAGGQQRGEFTVPFPISAITWNGFPFPQATWERYSLTKVVPCRARPALHYQHVNAGKIGHAGFDGRFPRYGCLHPANRYVELFERFYPDQPGIHPVSKGFCVCPFPEKYVIRIARRYPSKKYFAPMKYEDWGSRTGGALFIIGATRELTQKRVRASQK